MTLQLGPATKALSESLWSEGITAPIDALEQIALLLALHAWQAPPAGLEWSTWAHQDPATALALVRSQVWPAFLSRLDGALFAELPFLIQRPATLQALVAQAEALPWAEHPDLLGDICEVLLDQVVQPGIHGQFRTPAHLVRFMIAALDLQPGETLWDPACGTGSLLLEAVRQCPQVAVRGDDIDRRMARLAGINMHAHGLPPHVITHGDSLAWALDSTEPLFPAIAANPPFGGTVPARAVPALGKPSTKSEVQFLGAILQHLAPGGRAMVVVPLGLLFNRHATALRRYLLRNFAVQLIQLPSGAFLPHTGVATALLLARRTGPAEQVWFFDVQADGFALNKGRQPIPQNDLPAALAWLRSPQDDPLAWSCAVAQVLATDDCPLLPNRWAPAPTTPALEYEPPEKILADVIHLELEVLRSMGDLAALLGPDLDALPAEDAAFLRALRNPPNN